jgi:hypothetical protein
MFIETERLLFSSAKSKMLHILLFAERIRVNSKPINISPLCGDNSARSPEQSAKDLEAKPCLTASRHITLVPSQNNLAKLF